MGGRALKEQAQRLGTGEEGWETDPLKQQAQGLGTGEEGWEAEPLKEQAQGLGTGRQHSWGRPFFSIRGWQLLGGGNREAVPEGSPARCVAKSFKGDLGDVT